MRSFGVVPACQLGLAALAMSAALTNSKIDTCTTTNELTFSDLAFDSLNKQRTDLMPFHGAVGDSGVRQGGIAVDRVACQRALVVVGKHSAPHGQDNPWNSQGP